MSSSTLVERKDGMNFVTLGESSSSPVNAATTTTTGGGGSQEDDDHLHERDRLVELPEAALSSVVIESQISKLPMEDQAAEIVKQFNTRVQESAVTTSLVRGQRIDRNQFVLAHRNRVPELAPFHTNRIATAITGPNTIVEIISIVKQNDPFFGAHGSFVVNVPRGKYARVCFGTGALPRLLAQGVHVIHDVNFKYNPSEDLVDVSADQIRHQTIHILRVPIGNIAKIWLGSIPSLLYARGDGTPFVYDNVLFRFENFVPQNSAYISHGTVHILRVPFGYCAKVWIASEAKLLQARSESYQFLSPQFRLETPSKGGDFTEEKSSSAKGPLDVEALKYFYPSNVPYLNHGPIHILRVPKNKLVKVWLNNTEAELLEGRTEPYVFNDRFFRLEGNSIKTATVDVNSYYIRHGPIHIVRVPIGKIAKIYESGTEARILPTQPDPYRFHSMLFRLETREQKKSKKRGDEDEAIDSDDPDVLFWSTADSYISHGTSITLRVPSGRVAKCWNGSQALLLEASPEPYTFTSNMFRLEQRSPGNTPDCLFFDSTDKLIVHGSLKRIMPFTGEVAVLYENGQLRVQPPSSDGKPILIDSATCFFKSFLSTSVQTLVFPSETTKHKRKMENPNEKLENINYEVFKTKDSLDLGVKLMVAFRVIDPAKVLTTLGIEEILNHVENCFGNDTRVLTNFGFKFYHEIKALIEANKDVKYACYDKKSKTLCYRGGTLITKKNTAGKLISFTTSQELRRWQKENTYGRIDFDGTRSYHHVSLRVTPNHDMFVQPCTTVTPQSNGVRYQWPTRAQNNVQRQCPPTDESRGCVKMTAESLNPYNKTNIKAVRMLSVAENGLSIDETNQNMLDSILSELYGLSSSQQIDSFLELYGFWLGDGCLDYSCGKPYGVRFDQVKKSDVDFLVGKLEEMGLKEGEDWTQRHSPKIYTVTILNSKWVQSWDKEYGKKYPNSQYYDSRYMHSYLGGKSTAESVTDVKGVKWFWYWVLELLNRDRSRLILAGLHRAGGSYSAGINTIWTSSYAFRDQILRLCYHAGYSAVFTIGYTGTDRGCDSNGTSIVANHDQWLVNYCDAMSQNGKRSSWPIFDLQDSWKEEEYTEENVWCVTVDHKDHLIVAQRAAVDENQVVTKGDRPVICGNCATVDMGRAIQMMSSQEFLNSSQTKPKPKKHQEMDEKDFLSPILSTPGETVQRSNIQDIVKSNLSHDLAEYGIELVRLNIETPKILDKAIAERMATQSVATAEVAAKESVLEQNFAIARRQAEQEAEVKRIAQEQLNDKVLSAARADLSAAKLRAEAILIEAEAKQKAFDLQGRQYDQHPSLLQIELAKIQTEALKASKLNIIAGPKGLRQYLGPSMAGIPIVAPLGIPNYAVEAADPPRSASAN